VAPVRAPLEFPEPGSALYVAAMDLDAAMSATRRRYERWLDVHGAESSRAVGWNDPALQALRFDLLAQVMEGDEPVTVADFGCGTGSLFAHLAARAAPPPVAAYTGYDLVPAMVEAARGRHADPRARFEVGTEAGEEADYVLASGAFTLRAEVADADWEAHVQHLLEGLWASSRRGLGFNLLTRGVKVVEPGIYTGDPETWAAWCSRALPGARVALRYGPPLPDFTVLVRRATADGR
jgi:SAM-dependent methyltransferase